MLMVPVCPVSVLNLFPVVVQVLCRTVPVAAPAPVPAPAPIAARTPVQVVALCWHGGGLLKEADT